MRNIPTSWARGASSAAAGEFPNPGNRVFGLFYFYGGHMVKVVVVVHGGAWGGDATHTHHKNVQPCCPLQQVL